jgi:membrane dipeptidase
MRKLYWTVAMLAVALAAAFAWLPGYVESSMNGVLRKPPYQISARARVLENRIPIVDLHADSLLWSRDLLARGTRGQVDIPRLIEGHVALQAFTIVTKTPRGLNFQRNTSDSDNITLLSIVERWPPATWSSLTERALYQASRLRDFESRSQGKFTIIRSAADLRAYLDRRRADPAIAAGFLGIEGAHALDGNLANIDRLYDAGFRMMAPTHFFDNDIGGSSAGVDKTGLTDKGREMVRRMESRHMLVDLAHAAPRTIDDVLAIATRPVMVSHTGVKGDLRQRPQPQRRAASRHCPYGRRDRDRLLRSGRVRNRCDSHRPRHTPHGGYSGRGCGGAGLGFRRRGGGALRHHRTRPADRRTLPGRIRR